MRESQYAGELSCLVEFCHSRSALCLLNLFDGFKKTRQEEFFKKNLLKQALSVSSKSNRGNMSSWASQVRLAHTTNTACDEKAALDQKRMCVKTYLDCPETSMPALLS